MTVKRVWKMSGIWDSGNRKNLSCILFQFLRQLSEAVNYTDASLGSNSCTCQRSSSFAHEIKTKNMGNCVNKWDKPHFLIWFLDYLTVCNQGEFYDHCSQSNHLDSQFTFDVWLWCGDKWKTWFSGSNMNKDHVISGSHFLKINVSNNLSELHPFWHLKCNRRLYSFLYV